MTERYITTTDNGRYRVRIPQGDERINVGTYDALDEAIYARDGALGIVEDEGAVDRKQPFDQDRYLEQIARDGPFVTGEKVTYPSIESAPLTWPDIAHRAAELVALSKEAHRDMTRLGIVFREADPIDVPPNAHVITEKPLTATLDRWLYCSDIHAPLHSRLWIERLIRVGRALKIHDLVIGGDLADNDSISRHGRAEQQAGYKVTKQTAGDLVYLLGNEFRLWLLPGNHDDRLRKRLDDDVPFADFVYAALAGRTPRNTLNITDYSYLYVQGPNRKWVVGHPSFYSRTAAKGLADVAQLHQMSVIGAHNHLQGMMWSADGRHIAIDPGTMCDAELTPYIMRGIALSKFPTWRQGFVLIDNDRPTLFGDGLIEWGQYGC